MLLKFVQLLESNILQQRCADLARDVAPEELHMRLDARELLLRHQQLRLDVREGVARFVPEPSPATLSVANFKGKLR